jgi:hypothetical protein
MEGSYLKEVPKFKNPEEELNYLRAEVAKHERFSPGGSSEEKKHSATKSIVEEYKTISKEEVLHKSHAMSSKDSESIVLQLKPETHDVIMEELLGLLITKGVKNAFAVVEGLKNPHIDDDFHRLLIQYLKNNGTLVKQGSPLFRSLHMTLFEVTLPPGTDDKEKEKSFKDFIGAMEQFLCRYAVYI